MTPFWSDGTATIWHADALALPLPDASVDLIVTSPPYFGLRSYQDGGVHYANQIGSEPTPAEFVDALIAATREMVRVLKPSGSLWINLGDKYNSVVNSQGLNKGPKYRKGAGQRPDLTVSIKSLIGIPWRYALRCIDDLGLILRAEVIWSKPNGLPESVTDRVRRSHEQWFHFVREPRYYSAVDEVREGHLQPDRIRADVFGGKSATNGVRHAGATTYTGPGDSLGKLPGSVWTIPTQPLRVPDHLGVDHFAAFPMEWPRRIIRGWSPRDVCSACGEGRRPVAVKVATGQSEDASTWAEQIDIGSHRSRATRPRRSEFVRDVGAIITGYACACPGTTAPTTPGVILDPFGGTGTTALVAVAEGRTAHHVDLSADYCRLAQWRITDPGERARAREVEKPPVQIEGQAELFEGIA